MTFLCHGQQGAMPLPEKPREKKFTKIFFVTDVHGSDRTFRKFLSAGRLYEADIAMLCGDLTGKMLVPVVKSPEGTHAAKFLGLEEKVKTEQELNKLEERIRNAGFYPYRTDRDGMKELQAEPKKVDELFKTLMLERLGQWVKAVEEYYRDSGIKCIITGGNDDLPEVDSVLDSSSYVINSDRKLIRLTDYHEMITVGEANITPWKCPRDVTEEQLKEIIENLANKAENIQNCVFNLHAPPKDSGLDTAFMLDTSVDPPKVVTRGGTPVTIGVGSSAVRECIEKYQPLLGLHGHIHESRGMFKIGRTMCINPGSEYGEGIVRGAIVNVAKDKVLSYQLTSG